MNARLPFDDAGADLSPCGRYRYRLHRTWGEHPPVAFVMLNPSTADAVQLDPTVRRCIGYAQRWGYGGLIVGNLFALRSTDPAALYTDPEPIGEENDAALQEIATTAECVICAWGKHGALNDRGAQVLAMIRAAGATPQALKLNGDGSPAHPLYLKGDAEPFEVPA